MVKINFSELGLVVSLLVCILLSIQLLWLVGGILYTLMIVLSALIILLVLFKPTKLLPTLKRKPKTHV